MFADVLPYPSHVNDWYMLGWPGSLIAFLAVTASLIAMVVVLSRRFKGWHRFWILSAGLILFLAADYAVYCIGVKNQSWWRVPRPPPPVRPIESERKQ